MKKSIFTYLLLAAITILSNSCVKELWENRNSVSVPKDGIVLHIFTGDPQTRADEQTVNYPIPLDGETQRKENLIVGNKVDVFFFKTDAENAPIRYYALGQVIENGALSIPVVFDDVENIFNGLVPNQSTCNVLVIANYSSGNTTTLENSVYSGCSTRGDILALPLNVAHWSNAQQSSFVMRGTANLTLLNPKGSKPSSGDVILKRVASKISFNLTVASSTVNEAGTTWEPNLGSMSIYMVYAMRQAVLGGTPKTVPTGIKGVDYNIVDYEKDANDATYGNEFLYEYNARSLVESGQSVERIHNGETETCDVYVAGFKTNQGAVTDTDTPFYSYPATWDYGIATEPYLKLIIPWTTTTVSNGVTTTRTKYYYYKIPFSVNTLESNNWYRIYIDVQILGGEEPVPPVASVNYCISDWGGEVDKTTAQQETIVTVIPATVVAARYLSVPVTEYVLYNTDDLEIPITSSHAVEVVGFNIDKNNAYLATHTVDANYVGTNPRIYNPFLKDDAHLEKNKKIVIAKPDYSTDPAKPDSLKITFGEAASGDYGWSVTAPGTGKEKVVVHHQLNRNLSGTDYDVAPYTIRMRIRHTGDYGDSYYTDVTIEQRPPIIIHPEANAGGESNYGYAFVNGGQNSGTNGYSSGWWSSSFSNTDGSWTCSSQPGNTATYYLGSSPSDLSNSNNKNTNMYIIETSVLPTEGSISSYMLGDPRSKDINNLNGTKSSFNTTNLSNDATWTNQVLSLKDWDGNDRDLKYYYPVGMDAAFDDVIAPRIRIASSFGSTQYLSYYDAFRRCASYQESGYPAGRWRVPTKAEIMYIAQLNANGKIPLLLGSASGQTAYWCNSGYVVVEKNQTPYYVDSKTNSNIDSGHTYVRCMYDDWYWGESNRARLPEAKYNTFTWGDQTRESVNLAQ